MLAAHGLVSGRIVPRTILEHAGHVQPDTPSQENGSDWGYSITVGSISSPGFTLASPRPRYPVLIAVPHAGRAYPQAIFDNLRVPPESLVRLEDRYADLLLRDAATAGFSTLVAHHPRAWLDLNRAPEEIDAAMVQGAEDETFAAPSAKVLGGLGLIPRRMSGVGDIWKWPWHWADINARIAGYHAPYHAALASELARMRAEFGVAVLMDLHSMPALSPDASGKVPQIVIGDSFARSASNRISDRALSFSRQSGYHTGHNTPYPGGYVLRRHGDPGRDCHALQVEIDRSLYLDARLAEPDPGWARVAAFVARLALVLADEALAGRILQAAE